MNSDGSLVIVSAASSPSEGNDGVMQVDGRAQGGHAAASSGTHVTSDSQRLPVKDHHLPAASQDVTQPSPDVDSVDQLSSSVNDVCELPPAVDNVTEPSPVDYVTQPLSSDGYNRVESSKQEGASNSHVLSSLLDEAAVNRDHPKADCTKVMVAPMVTFQLQSAVDSLTAPLSASRGQRLKAVDARAGKGPMRLVINEDESSNSLSDSEFITPAEGRKVWVRMHPV